MAVAEVVVVEDLGRLALSSERAVVVVNLGLLAQGGEMAVVMVGVVNLGQLAQGGETAERWRERRDGLWVGATEVNGRVSLTGRKRATRQSTTLA
jgi:hypothetical protein